jgi:hypothetical protein
VRAYHVNARHWAYVAAKLLRPSDALAALAALVARSARNALRADPRALAGIPRTLGGFAHGLRNRRPVSNPELSRFYRDNFHSFVNPLRLARPARELVVALPREALRRTLLGEEPAPAPARREQFLAERARVYPREAAVLDFASDARRRATAPG